MTNYTLDQSKKIFQDAKSRGLDTDKVMAGLVNGGATFEGIDMNAAKEFSASFAQPEEDLGLGGRLGEITSRRGENVRQAISAEDEFAGRGAISRGIGASAEAAGAISEVGYSFLPKPVRNLFDKIGGGIGKGFNWLTDKISNSKFLQEAMSGDPENTKKLEDALQIGSDLGLIAGEAVGASELAGLTGRLGALSGKGIKAGARGIQEGAEAFGKSGDNALKKQLDKLEPQTFDEAVASIEKGYKTAFIADKVGTNQKLTKRGMRTGQIPDEIVRELAEAGIIPEVEGKLAKFDKELTNISSKQQSLSDNVRRVIKASVEPTTLDDFKALVIADVNSFGSASGLNKTLRGVESSFDSFRKKYGDTLTPENLHDIKIDAWDNSKAFKKSLSPQVSELDAFSSIGAVARRRIDDIVQDPIVHQANAEWGRLANLETTIRIFDNQPIDVGVFGKQAGRLGGALAIGGATFPVSGPGALVVAGIAATFGAKFVEKFLRTRKFSKVAKELIRKEATKNPSVLDDLLQVADAKDAEFLNRLKLEGPKPVGTPENPIITPEPSQQAQFDARARNVLGKKDFSSTRKGAKLDNLSEQARKFDTAEEFVKAKEKDIVYHGSNEGIEKFDDSGAFFTDDLNNADGYASGEFVYEGYLDMKKPLVIDAKGRHHSDLKTPYGESTQEIVGKVDSKKYDGVIFKNINDSFADDVSGPGTDTIFYPFNANKSFINESQLTDIFNKAKKP
ncbi:MAG: hypothetical protein DRP42_05770 [Tenericutes bacterium]|nr:MAG: hypothetical protein DRP42_05770 [Mycoplasmatota bacterium]